MSAVDWSVEMATELGGSLPAGTVTLLLADVEGSTRLWEAQPSEMRTAIARLDPTVAELVAAHDGARPVEQGEGDSFVAAFARASDAVACALDLQDAVPAPIRLRIGVHTGEVQLRDEGNYMGSTVNKAARLRDLAHGGQTVLSAATEELVSEALPSGAWIIDLGEHRVRDLARPIRVAQLCHPELTNEFPPLRTVDPVVVPHLPAHLTRFIGRAEQIIQVRALLVENRLTTFTGAGGAGKTRLAIEAAGGMAPDFPDGIWYVDLSPVTRPEVVPLAVARTLGLPDQPGQAITDTMRRFAANRRMLVVLDNCEHLLDACATLLGELLGTCAGLTVLATSREPIGVPGELTWQVPSLSLADEAPELFADRARRVRPDFVITDANHTAVKEICRRLDGMPLAIELAAARVRSLTLEEIVESLHDRFRLLTGGARTAVRRQQTLRASVDWSHALLTDSERTLFRRLAVFAGGFDVDAARAVAGTTVLERLQVFEQLSLLVDKSLVSAASESGATRYRMLETVRQYAMEKLGESGEADTIRGRHRDHYLSLTAQLDAPPSGMYEELITRAEKEIDNIRSAFIWCIENSDAAEALELATMLQPLWLARGRLLEGLAWLEAASQLDDATPLLRARALADKAILNSWVDVTGNLETGQSALAVAREAGDRMLLIRALAACACVTAHDVEAARPYFDEAIEIARAEDDWWRLSLMLARRAYGLFMQGDTTAIEAAAAEGLQLSDSIGDHFNSRQCRWALIGAYGYRGQLQRAADMIDGYLEEAAAAHDGMATMIGLLVDGFVSAFRGDNRNAHVALTGAMQEAAHYGGIFDHAIHSGWAQVHLAAGDADAAWESLLAADRTSMNPPAETANKAWLADAALAAGHPDVARDYVERVLSGFTGWWRACALTTRAAVFETEGRHDLALADVHDALRSAGESRAYLRVPDALEFLARLCGGAGSLPESARLFGAAHAMRQRTGLVRYKVYDSAYEDGLAELRKMLGDSDFRCAWSEGEALSTDDAISYAQRGRGQRKRPDTGWGALTPTEREVVRLVGDGLANRDIAARLFVSPRTVQSHLRHVYNKLGLVSRVQLAQEATRQL